MLEDDRVIEESILRNWYSGNAMPQLAGHSLLGGGNPMRWMIDRTLAPAEIPSSYIEFYSGDRLPGRTIAHHDAAVEYQADMPEYFEVAPSFPFNRSDSSYRQVIRVRRDFVRKIVWQQVPALTDRHVPSTLFLTNGREIQFRAIRFDSAGVNLLAGRERMSFGFQELAELHFDRESYWDTHLKELAILFPGGTVESSDRQRLVQWETADGLVATTSVQRIDAESHGDNNNSDRWSHGIQPAWSLDTIWVACRSTWMWRSWHFDTVPLFRLPLTESREGAMFSRGGFAARINRGVLGGTAGSGQRPVGWSLGVMAPSRLSFPLPEWAVGFQTSVAIDQAAHDRGCIQGEVLFSWEGKPKFASETLVGSSQVASSGNLRIDDVPQNAELILAADPVYEGRPEGADPFDIRDMTNWLEPSLLLDQQTLREKIRARTTGTILAWHDWKLENDLSQLRFANTLRRVQYPYESPSWRTTVAAVDEPLRLTIKKKIAPETKYLEIVTAKFEGPDQPEISVRINGIPVMTAPLQNTNSNDHVHSPPPYLINVTPFAGSEATIEVSQSVAQGDLSIDWRGLHFREQPSFLLPVLETPTQNDVNKMTTLAGEPGNVILRDDIRQLSRPLIETPDGEWIQIANFDSPIEIRERPEPGQFRQLRFAVSKTGKGHALIRFLHENEEDSPAIYAIGTRNAGQGIIELNPRSFDNKKEIDENWQVITPDLYSNFRELDITGIAVKSVGESSCLWDQIYFAGTAWYLDRNLSVNPTNSNWDNWQKRSEELLPGLTKATLQVHRPGKPVRPAVMVDQGSGILAMLGDDDWKPGTEMEVTRHDGKTFTAKQLGKDESSQFGLLQIVSIEQDGGWQQYNLSSRTEFDWQYSHLIFQPGEEPGQLAWDICRPLTYDKRVVIVTKPHTFTCEVGAIAVDRDHQFSGFVTEVAPNGQPVISIARPLVEKWHDLKNQQN
ncbi:hypothetical protein DTL21_15790 [Bremerella cremea]|uniref:Uncharacterized protein n=1 Tax=Blastopirellula marina TaxID=124 RepID=A0A2S8FSB4_9BACT|nr:MULTISPECIES: hypothetical protein [Pirellulaceae]PQO34940.1 hypothetical protein C5Y83_15775 [Blastopirellula marina]RCS47441.1 hypothetical protein DTL21_15790 [Bremerella cremea]